MAFSVRRLAIESPAARAFECGGMQHGLGWEHFACNGPVALQGEQIVGRSGGVMCGAEDFILVLLQNVDPRAHIRGVLLGVMRDSPLCGQKNARQLRAQLLLGVGDIAESVRLVESRAIQARGVPGPVGKLVQRSAVVACCVVESMARGQMDAV